MKMVIFNGVFLVEFNSIFWAGTQEIFSLCLLLNIYCI